MKKEFLKILGVVTATILLTVTISAKGFGKTQEYKGGQFTDVPEKQWYASEVKSAYELGFMNGQSDTLFVPEGNVTVAEGITMASRVHSIYNGKAIAEKSGGKWYDMYIAYAKENGLIEDGQFAGYDRNIMRYEMAMMFAKAMPSDYFTPINDIKDIPDVDEKEDYYDELMMLYKAGVVLGSDDYGNFYATNPIKRSETAAIINRVALPENRKTGTLLEYGNREQAVFLIDDRTMSRTVRKVTSLASGWNYEDLDGVVVNTNNSTSNALADSSKEGRVAIHRDVTVQETGVVKVDSSFTVSENSGACVYFSDLDGTKLFELSLRDGKYVAGGDKEYVIENTVSAVSATKVVYFELDIDRYTAKVVIDGKDAGEFAMNKSAKNLARMSYATTEKDELLFSVQTTRMYVNYTVNDDFIYNSVGEKPYGWDVTGNVLVETKASDWEMNSVKLNGKAAASRKFEKIRNKFVYETYVLPTQTADGALVLKNGEKTALKIEMKNGQFYFDGKVLRKYDSRCWHLIRVEADTDKNTAVIKINNKKILDTAFAEDGIDTIEIINNNADELWFDDVKVYNVYDYADYVPTPVSVNNDEWLVGMSVCSLWREGTHYGWDCISPYEEITPVLGFYDEGLPEVADWEIKFLAEHGFDFQHYCWYGTNSSAIKKTSLSEAVIDGYMNAKYSDMMHFMIMWENANMSGKKPERFYEINWPYWCEWFFSDPRYLVIDNKPVITVYQYDKFVETLGGYDEAKKAAEFMNEDIKRYGFDGIILLACGTFDNFKQEDFSRMKDIGFEARVTYTLGEQGYDPDYQIKKMTDCHNQNGLTFIPSIGVGFNDIGWTECRTPLITPENMVKVAQWTKDEYLPLIAETEEKDRLNKLVFYTTWNEYGEGHYIFPTNTHKFGYVDANRAVFSSVAGKNDAKHFDVEPTLNQKSRLCYLYPARQTPMRRTMYIDSTSSIENNAPVITWDFEKEEDVNKWVRQMNCTDVSYDASEKALFATTTTNDGGISVISSIYNNVDANKARYLHVQIKYEKGADKKFQVFFVHDDGEYWSGDKRIDSPATLTADGQYHDYYIDLSGNIRWNGIVKDLRFDPMSEPGNFWVKKIEFLSDKSVGSYSLDVDGTQRTFGKEFVKKAGDEVFIAGNPSDGFYSLLNLYTEYNLSEGTLELYGKNGSRVCFVVGSDNAVINGKNTKLAMAVERVDGLVTVPVKLICDTFGYEYTENDDGLSVRVRKTSYDDVIAKRTAFNYEFEVPGDTEGWAASRAKGNVVGGCYIVTADPVGYSATGYDPRITNYSVNMVAKEYTEFTFRLRPSFIETDALDITKDQVSLYFTTDLESEADEKKTFKIKYTDMVPDEEGFYSYTVKTTENEKWKGAITSFYFDMSNRGGMFEIDYIRFICEEKEDTVLMVEDENLVYEDPDNPFLYEFNEDGNTQKWRLGRADGTVSGGKLIMTAKELDSKPGSYDPMMDLSGVEIPADKYYEIHFRVKPVLLNMSDLHTKKGNLSIYFITDSDVNVDEAKAFKVPYIDMKLGSDGFYSGIVNCKSNSKWAGTIKYLRFDPSNFEGTYEIDYIRVIGEKVPQNENTLQEEVKEEVKEEVVVVKEYNFNSSDLEGWVVAGTSSGKASFVYEDGAVKITTAEGNKDPQFSNWAVGVDSSKISYIEVRLKKTSTGEEDAQLFYVCDGAELSADNSYKIKYSGTDWTVLTFNVKDFTGVWNGNLKNLRFDPGAMANASYYIDYIRLIEGKVPTSNNVAKEPEKEVNLLKEYSFNANDLEGWVVAGTSSGKASFVYEDGAVKITTSDSFNDPQFSNWAVNVDSSKIAYIKVRLKKTTAGEEAAQLFYVCDSGELNGDNSMKIKYSGTDWSVLTFKADEFTGVWGGNLKNLRFDPGSSAGASYSIDYIKIVGK